MGHGRTTLFDVSAISGAAVSPLMGSATRHAYRLLFTATNVRLGVWIPHPTVVRDARQSIDDPAGHGRADRAWWVRHPLLLLVWYLLPHQLWGRDAERTARETGRERRPGSGPTCSSSGRRQEARRRSGTGCMQPTLGLLWAEAAGQPELPRHLDVRHRRRPLRQPRPWSRRCAAGPRTSWCSTPRATRRTRGSPSAVPSPWPGPTREWRSSSTRPRWSRAAATWPRVRSCGPGRYGTFRRLVGAPTAEACDPLDDPQPVPATAAAGQDLGLQARLVDGRALGRPGLRQAPSHLPLRQHAGAAVRRQRVQRLPAARSRHGPRRGPGVGRRPGQEAVPAPTAAALRRARHERGRSVPGRDRSPGTGSAQLRRDRGTHAGRPAMAPG